MYAIYTHYEAGKSKMHQNVSFPSPIITMPTDDGPCRRHTNSNLYKSPRGLVFPFTHATAHHQVFPKGVNDIQLTAIIANSVIPHHHQRQIPKTTTVRPEQSHRYTPSKHGSQTNHHLRRLSLRRRPLHNHIPSRPRLHRAMLNLPVLPVPQADGLARLPGAQDPRLRATVHVGGDAVGVPRVAGERARVLLPLRIAPVLAPRGVGQDQHVRRVF
ncbi:hypothetical protein J3458_009298 [Metarhizium acridum]|uniref:uncharacterized protein n=1 Tax=Metarhizium acridum TaxID=92637 RepID=UPI001C6CABE1|nr:hypothetical protein J3458_009298 [Metarhizium acridum]